MQYLTLFPVAVLAAGLSLLLTEQATAQARQLVEVKGTVYTDAGEPLPDATVYLDGSGIGGNTGAGGTFSFDIPATAFPAVIKASYIGYETSIDTLRGAGQRLEIFLAPSLTLISDVVVSASRVEENILRAPVTVDKLNAQHLARLSTPDLVMGLARQKGVDVTSSGLLMASASTRGFSGATSERLVQLVDMMDTQSPSLNINPGNALGLPEVDMASVEVLHGPSSALYGANAFNGVVLTTSKDPFQHPGLSVRLRGGTRRYLDGQLRYARRLGQRWALKLTGSYATGQEWIAATYDPLTAAYAPGNNAQGSGLGYDAVNRYGDVGTTFGPTGGALNGKTVFMPGWTEREIIAEDDVATMWKLLPSVHFMVTDKVKAMVEFKRAQGTTAYQYTNRYRFKNIATNQYRAELKSDRWFVRAYQTQDFGEDSYDLSFTGTYMQTAVDPRSGGPTRSYAQQYFNAYALAYNTFLANPANAGNTAGAEQAARAQAAPFQLTAGSPEFNALRKQIITDETPGKGTQLNPSSFLSDLSTQYEWRSAIADGVIGGAYRQYRLGSKGQLFSDQDGKRIINDEYGIYTQLTKTAWKQKLKFMGAARLDGFQNFPQLFSPRVAMIYSAGKKQQQAFRASFGQAFRSPTQQGQYLHLDLQRLILLGNVGQGFQGYSTEIEGVLPTILSSQTPAETTLQAYEVSINNLKPERVATWEIGYKGQPIPKLTIDANFYISNYQDFIRQVRFIGNVDGSRPTPAQLAAAATGVRPLQTGPTRVIQVQANAAQQVHASGSMASLTYTPRKQLNLTGNYTLSLLERKRLPERFQAYYNTPRHKFNLGAYGEVGKAFSYSLNYRWAEGHLFESPFAAGQLKDYSTLDADLGFRLPKQHTVLQVGGTNLLNSRNIQVYGGPQIGRLVYLGLTVEVK